MDGLRESNAPPLLLWAARHDEGGVDRRLALGLEEKRHVDDDEAGPLLLACMHHCRPLPSNKRVDDPIQLRHLRLVPHHERPKLAPINPQRLPRIRRKCARAWKRSLDQGTCLFPFVQVVHNLQRTSSGATTPAKTRWKAKTGQSLTPFACSDPPLPPPPLSIQARAGWSDGVLRWIPAADRCCFCAVLSPSLSPSPLFLTLSASITGIPFALNWRFRCRPGHVSRRREPTKGVCVCVCVVGDG